MHIKSDYRLYLFGLYIRMGYTKQEARRISRTLAGNGNN